MGHDSAEIVLSVNELDSCLDVVLLVDPEHQSGLVEADLVLTGNLHLNLELASTHGIEERGIINGEPIVGYPPVVALRGHIHSQDIILDRPVFRFIEPLHPVKRLRRQNKIRQEHNKNKQIALHNHKINNKTSNHSGHINLEFMDSPPSTTMLWPVQKVLVTVRKYAHRAISSGDAHFFSGVCSII